MTMWRAARFIARKDIRYLLQRRETILWTFLMPVLFFYFIGTITGGFSGGRGAAKPALDLYAPADAGPLAEQIATELEARGYAVTRVAHPDSAHGSRLLRLPPALSDTVLAGRQAVVKLVRRGEGVAVDYDEVRVQRALYTVLADLVVLSAEQTAPDAAAFDAIREAPRPIRVETSAAGTRREIPSGFAQAIPGTMVMFTLLVLLTSGAVLLVVERRQGLLRRLAATPIPRGGIVLGKWMGRMSLAVVQVGFAMALGTVLFHMDWGADVAMVGVVLFVYAAFNASLGLLLGSVARNEGQAVAIGVLSANLLAALGGCWWPIEVTPAWMQKLSLFLPTGITMDALHKLVHFGAGAASATPHVVALALASLAIGWLATRAFRYQ